MPLEQEPEAEAVTIEGPRRRRFRWCENSEADHATEFRPSPRRWYGRKALVFVAWTGLLEGLIAAAVAGITITGADKSATRGSDYWWSLLLLGPLIAFRVYAGFTNPMENYVIRVTKKEVVGPELQRWPWQVRPYTIRLEDIDPFRSAQRSILDRFLGRQYLYSNYGTKIFLQRRSFNQDEVRRLLGLLRVRD
jgi:hypothetical protein